MTSTRDREDRPRRRQLDRLVRLDDSVTEAAEAAAQAAAHAVEATKAAEAAAAARAARKAKAAKAEAGRAAKAAEVTVAPRPGGDEATSPDIGPVRVLEVALTEPDLDRIEQKAAEQDVPAEQLARSLLRDALGRSEDSPTGAAADPT